ncbi:uncharacterized protein EV420DRAFT_1512925 [Desarmillaria tabescens]|uniref:Uncharacterized protein n=1 Tax=Armillaria tabescens TaxID=1929756 RepID=A0AA39NGP3_ARMTA|nr:uncharacterized protein EV420DRAFT_1512925 [Desarmillaria tabescens]KAK0465128.1 hypothetical protein EV420DRAFT_1512925 [Desarmillaria tabescens]
MADSPAIRIHARLDALEQELAALNALPPDATPGTTTRRQKLIAEIHKRMNQISSMGILARRRSTARSTGGGARKARGNQVVPAASDAPPADIVQTRVEELLTKFDGGKYPPLSANDFTKKLMFPDLGRREVIEDLAFVRLIRGYKDTQKNWYDALLPLVQTRNTWEKVCIRTADMKKIPNDMDRLVAMNQFLLDQVGVGACETFVDYVTRAIETIRYVKIWDAHDVEDDDEEAEEDAPPTGGRKWKIDFLKRSFRAEQPEAQLELDQALATGDETVIKEAKQAYESKLGSHRKKHQHLMEMRRPLAMLYDYFGAAVLLDPFWDVTDKGRKRRRSGVFDEMLMYLCQHLPEENFVHVPATRYETAHSSLTDVLTTLATPVAQHAEDFLDMYAPISFGK